MYQNYYSFFWGLDYQLVSIYSQQNFWVWILLILTLGERMSTDAKEKFLKNMWKKGKKIKEEDYGNKEKAAKRDQFLMLKNIWKKGKIIREEHSEKYVKATSYECEYCNKVMSRSDKLNEHIKRKHTEVCCKYCQQTFKVHLELIKHLSTDHQNQKYLLQEYAEFQCEFCDRFLSKKDHLKRHIIRFHK